MNTFNCENKEVKKPGYKTLKARGYTKYFEMEFSTIYCGLLDLRLTPEKFTVDEIYRFEENSNPDDSSVLYVISTDIGIKGTLVDAYGVYAENLSFDMANKLQITNGR
jgi:hypothetical protein